MFFQHENNFDVNSDDEEELPIWICGEPRYITGITSTTTCNDILGALIEDEIHNGNLDGKFLKKIIKNIKNLII